MVQLQLPVTTSGNVVVPERDFLSNFIAWAMLEDRGYELRLVEDDEGALPVDSFAEAVDLDTAVIVTSWVQSSSGFKVDIEALRDIARSAGSWLVIDAVTPATTSDSTSEPEPRLVPKKVTEPGPVEAEIVGLI